MLDPALLAGWGSFPCAAEQFLDSCLELRRTVELKEQFGRAAQVQALGQFPADECGCRMQSRHGPRGLLIVPFHRYEDTS